jgi:hypothetical protein
MWLNMKLSSIQLTEWEFKLESASCALQTTSVVVLGVLPYMWGKLYSVKQKPGIVKRLFFRHDSSIKRITQQTKECSLTLVYTFANLSPVVFLWYPP